MVERSYSNSDLAEIIKNALTLALRRGGLENGRAAGRMLVEGFDLNTAFAALRRHLHHSRAEASPVDARTHPNAWWATVYRQQQRSAAALPVVRAEALAILRAALTPTGPFVTIPKLGNAFHIRYRSLITGIENGISYSSDIIEIVTDDGILAGSNVVMLLRPTKHPGGPRAVPQKLIDKLDRKACATLTAEGKPLKKEARANLIKPDLATKGYVLAEGTIKNRLKAKRP
jgi:hypothetical protein